MHTYYLGEILDMKLLVTVSFSYFQFSIHMGTYFQSPIFAYTVHIYLCNLLETKDNIGLMSSSHELVMEFQTFLFKCRLKFLESITLDVLWILELETP